MKVAVALVHYPIYDRAKNLVATNVTNFDIHDIARACSTYDIDKYFIVHPMKEQLMFVSRVLDHWRVGDGSKHNPMRRTALNPVETVENLESISQIWGGGRARFIATSARPIESKNNFSFRQLRESLKEVPTVLVFGTGFGLATEVIDFCDGVLEPIKGVGPRDYRHLSVRSAVSICLDRLLGAW